MWKRRSSRSFRRAARECRPLTAGMFLGGPIEPERLQGAEEQATAYCLSRPRSCVCNGSKAVAPNSSFPRTREPSQKKKCQRQLTDCFRSHWSALGSRFRGNDEKRATSIFHFPTRPAKRMRLQHFLAG